MESHWEGKEKLLQAKGNHLFNPKNGFLWKKNHFLTYSKR
jgi:hypothetical protein